MDEIVGDVPAYINFPRGLIINGIAQLLPADKVVLEILETVKLDHELKDALKALVDVGYKIALDNFTYADELQPLIEIADAVKLDIREHSFESLKEQIKYLKGSKAKLIAEKVETQEEYKRLLELGFEYFQGNFFSKPVIMSQNSILPNKTSMLHLISQLQNPDTDIDEIEEIISQDISLSYKLFRYINSVFFGIKNKLTSVKQAVVYFGIQPLKNWVTLIALTGNTQKPVELMMTSLVRAKMCELIAEETGVEEANAYFIVGMFSLLDALLDQYMTTILEHLPLDDSINNAILEYEGDMGKALLCCISCERCAWEEITYPDIEMGKLCEIHLEAMIWAQQILSEIA